MTTKNRYLKYYIELCKGCVNIKEGCVYTRFSSLCPCTKCLVKVTCEVACDDYFVLQNLYTNTSKTKLIEKAKQKYDKSM